MVFLQGRREHKSLNYAVTQNFIVPKSYSSALKLWVLNQIKIGFFLTDSVQIFTIIFINNSTNKYSKKNYVTGSKTRLSYLGRRPQILVLSG